MRTAEIKRKTAETDIQVSVNLDGTDTYDTSPATTTLFPLRTETMVVPCQPGKSLSFDIQHSKRISPYLGV